MQFLDMEIGNLHPETKAIPCAECHRCNETAWDAVMFRIDCGPRPRPTAPQMCSTHVYIPFKQRVVCAYHLDDMLLWQLGEPDEKPSLLYPVIAITRVNGADIARTQLHPDKVMLERDDNRPQANSLADWAGRAQRAF